MRTKILLGIIILMSLNCSIFSQESDYYYDFNVDYFPRAQSLKYDTTSNIQIRSLNEGELIETLEFITKRILGKDKILTRMSGLIMMSSGICPPQIRDAEKWIKIEIDKDGKINKVEIYQNAAQINIPVSNQFQKILETAKFNPAIKKGAAVNIRLYYIVETK